MTLKRLNETPPNRRRLARLKECREKWVPSECVFASKTSADGKIAELSISHSKGFAAAERPHVIDDHLRYMNQQKDIRVHLPTSELIDSWAFVRTIVEASIPDMTPKASGMACVVGKRLTLSAIPGIGSLTFAEQELDDTDRQYLSGVLHELPTLQLPITEDLAESFLTAYRSRADRRAWEPVLITEARYLAEQEKRTSLRRDAGWRHRETLQKLLDEGHLAVYGEGRVPLKELLVGSMILREDAAAYLTLCHIDYGSGIQPSSLVKHAADSVPAISTTDEGKQKALPEGLTTPEIVAVFSGMEQGNFQWSRVTEYPWAASALMAPGGKGRGKAARWNPVILAVLAMDKFEIQLKAFAARFRAGKADQRYERLGAWLDVWREEEERRNWWGK